MDGDRGEEWREVWIKAKGMGGAMDRGLGCKGMMHGGIHMEEKHRLVWGMEKWRAGR